MAHSLAPQPTVKELIALHAASIAQLKQDTTDFAGKDIGIPFDDLFILRYVLSAKGDLKSALKKIRETLEYRIANLDQLNDAANGNIPHFAKVTKHTKDGVLGWLGNDMLYAGRFGLMDLNALFDAVTEDEFLAFESYSNEAAYRVLDQRTRDTGVLCKAVSAIDLHGFAMSRFNRKFTAALAKSSHQNSVHYPQFLRTSVLINLPTIMRLILKATNLILPKETVEKQRVCPGKPRGGKQTAADCPYLKSRLGGDGAAAIKMMPPFWAAPLQCSRA